MQSLLELSKNTYRLIERFIAITLDKYIIVSKETRKELFVEFLFLLERNSENCKDFFSRIQ